MNKRRFFPSGTYLNIMFGLYGVIAITAAALTVTIAFVIAHPLLAGMMALAFVLGWKSRTHARIVLHFTSRAASVFRREHPQRHLAS